MTQPVNGITTYNVEWPTLLQYIVKQPGDLDKLLVMIFTNYRGKTVEVIYGYPVYLDGEDIRLFEKPLGQFLQPFKEGKFRPITPYLQDSRLTQIIKVDEFFRAVLPDFSNPLRHIVIEYLDAHFSYQGVMGAPPTEHLSESEEAIWQKTLARMLQRIDELENSLVSKKRKAPDTDET